MKFTSLTLSNYRGFASLTLNLDRPLTVLAGVNGVGKTTLLEALVQLASVMLMRPLRTTGSELDFPGDADIRIGEDRALLRVSATHEGESATWEVECVRKRELGISPGVFVWRSADTPAVLYFPATRTVARGHGPFQPQEHDDERHPMYRDWLSGPRGGFASFFRWFKEREDVENEQKVARTDFSHEDPHLAAIRRAVASMLPGFTGLRVQRDPLHLVVRKDATLLLLDQLSEGERDLLVMVADIARRLCLANPTAPDPLASEAVVLIDEVELHLHPAWQRMVVGALQRTFPRCQFIVTTHSPQVLGEVPNDAVVLVKDFQVWRPPAPTEGRDANAILWEVLGVTAHPAAVAAALDAIGDLIDGGRYGEARASLDGIAEKLTERDPEVLALRSALDLTERLDAAAGKEPAA
ncbi:MAG: AAA family ATPase [Polyangiales bacterium]